MPERTDTLRRGLRHLGRGIARQPRTFTIAVVGSAVYGACTAGGGWVLGRATTLVIAPAIAAHHVTGGQLLAAGGALAIVAVLTAAGVVVRRIWAGTTMNNLQAIYRREVSRQYLRLPLAWHHRHPTGQLLSNASSDVEAAFMIFSPLPFAIGVLVMLVVAAVSMLVADWVLALVGLTVLPAVMIANVVYQRYVSARVIRAQRLRAEVASVAHESFDGALVVKTLGREAEETARFTAATDRLKAANIAVGRTRGVFDPMIEAIPTYGTLAVLLLGTWRVQSGGASAGDVVQVAYLLTLLAFPVRAIGWVLGDLPRAVVGWERLDAVLRATGEMPFGTGSAQGTGAASADLQGVDYSFDVDGTPTNDTADTAQPGTPAERVRVLHDLELPVRAGTTVAIVGPTGSGKSTVASLLVRLVDPEDGEVLLDGADVRDLAAGQVAAAASLVPQSTFVFDDSVRGNVALGADVDDADVWRALRLARADGFVAALPAGLDTRVGERGASLSGGQRQRLALARALVRQPRLLVLDDATSAVDPRVEAAILAGLRGNGSGPVPAPAPAADHIATTVVVIAYRKATIALADEVVHVERGRVIDRGRHEDLVARNERYRHLVNAYEEQAAIDAEVSG